MTLSQANMSLSLCKLANPPKKQHMSGHKYKRASQPCMTHAAKLSFWMTATYQLNRLVVWWLSKFGSVVLWKLIGLIAWMFYALLVGSLADTLYGCMVVRLEGYMVVWLFG